MYSPLLVIPQGGKVVGLEKSRKYASIARSACQVRSDPETFKNLGSSVLSTRA